MNQQREEAEGSESAAVSGRIAAALATVRAEVVGMLAQEPAAAPDVLLELARQLDAVVRTGHGLLLRTLARADQAKAARGGIGTWLTAELGHPPGKARTLAEDARRLGALPTLAEELTSGALSVGATRVLARAAHAVAGTQQDRTTAVVDALAALQRDGFQAAERHVRVLEHTVGPAGGQELRSRQRARCFGRVAECESGMVHFEALLDAERGTLLRTALDLQVSTWLRERQYDHTNPLPDDVHSTEQLTAEAFARLAEVFLNATEAQRANRYTPTVIYYAPEPGAAPTQESARDPEPMQESTTCPTLPTIPPDCAETAYGTFIPANRLPGPCDPDALHLTLTPDGHPTALDGQPLDSDPRARLASPAQRLALAFRDRHCTFPGCTRPSPWALHAHHRTPYSQNGATTITNLTLKCPQHHTLAHQTAA